MAKLIYSAITSLDGTQAFPDNVRLPLDLLDERRFGNGMIYLRYRTGT